MSAERLQPGTRQARGRARRQAIVDAAAELFSRHGFRGTSVAAVAEAVGITDAGVLYHFPSKEDLLLAVLQHQDRVQASTMVTTAEGLAAVAALADWGDFMEAEADLIALHIKLSGEHLHDDSATNRYFRVRYEFLRDFIADSIRNGQAGGEVRADADADHEASVLIAVIDGLRLQFFLVPGTGLAAPLRRHVESTVARLRA